MVRKYRLFINLQEKEYRALIDSVLKGAQNTSRWRGYKYDSKSNSFTVVFHTSTSSHFDFYRSDYERGSSYIDSHLEKEITEGQLRKFIDNDFNRTYLDEPEINQEYTIW